jgi:N-acetylglucosaminyl-diphospho-decaprenol L-rhamnosyltransferase
VTSEHSGGPSQHSGGSRGVVPPSQHSGGSRGVVPPSQHSVDCAIVVVTYNSARHISRLLDSIPAACAGITARCVVVDNGSADRTAELVRGHPAVTLVETGSNLGYAGAINVGRRHAGQHAALVVLNPDVVLEPGAISRLRATLTDQRVGVAVPRLLNEDGSLYLSLRREPTPLRALGEAIFGSHLPGRPAWLAETIRAPDFYRHEQHVAWAGGAALIISAACCNAVGDWDSDRFFLYAEETDFAARARAAGFQIRYIPDATVRHEGGGSGQSPGLTALMAVNRIRYYEKYHRRPATSLFRAAVALDCLLRSASAGHRYALATVTLRSRWHRLPSPES